MKIMKKEKREFIKKFDAVVKDMLDNFDKYTDEEKAQVKDLFHRAVELNEVLDKYDTEKKAWKEFLGVYGRYFDDIM